MNGNSLRNSVSIGCLAVASMFATPAIAQVAAPPAPTPSTSGTSTAPQQVPTGAQDASGTQPSQQPGTPVPAAEAAGQGSGDIIVTAQRRDERLSRIGVTVAAVSADQLRQLNVKSTVDLARVVPGFQAGFSASGGAPNYYLRGVGFNTQNANNTAPVGVYVDEVAYAYPYMSLAENYDLERVEVLKGPQGTFYGRNATGGLVNFITAKPTDHFAGSLTGGYGNFGHYEFSGFVSGPLTDTLKARLAFDSENRGTWQHSITRDDRLGKLHRNAVRGTVDWDPTDRLHFVLGGNYWRRTGDTQAPQAIASVFGTPSAAVLASLQPNTHDNKAADWTPDSDQPQENITGIHRPPLTTRSSFYAMSLRAAYDLNDNISLVSLTGYNHLKHQECVDSAGVQVEQVVQCNYGYIRSTQEEVRLIGTSERFNWSVGGYYANDDTHEYTLGYAGELPTILGLRAFALTLPHPDFTDEQINTSYRLYSAFADTNDRVLAGFANAEFKLNDKFKIALGGRYTDDRLKFYGSGIDTNGNNIPLINTVFPILTGNPVAAVPNGSFTLNDTLSGFVTPHELQHQHNVAWRANFTYTPTSQLLFYAQVSRGYKSGSFPVFAASNVTQLEPVSQEKLTDYEGGAKYTSGRFQINGSGFYYDYRNRQVYGQVADLIFGTLPRIVNVPKSRVYGFEGDMTLRVQPTLTFRLAAAYLNAKIQRYSGFNENGVIQDFKGTTFPFAPKLQMSGSVNKDVNLNDRLVLELGVDGSYQTKSNSYIGEIPLYRIDSYPLVGTTVSLFDKVRNLRLTGYVRNLFDQYYWTSAVLGHDTAVRIAGMPRTYGFRLTKNF